jgi:dihydroorotase
MPGTARLVPNFPLIDMHAHLRDDVLHHTQAAKEGGVSLVVAMPNTTPCLDDPEAIMAYAAQESAIPFYPTSAITVNRERKRLVDIEAMKPHAVGFTDDGNCLTDLGLLDDALSHGVLVMLHCGEENLYSEWPRHTTETEWVGKYLELNQRVKGNLYLQHMSRKGSIELVRQAKKDGIPVTAETCPHYFLWTNETMRVPVNPPIGDKHDRYAVREGLADGTIDVIASDYAPEDRPKFTGIADWDNYVNHLLSLVFDGVLTMEQLHEKVHYNPRKILVGCGNTMIMYKVETYMNRFSR